VAARARAAEKAALEPIQSEAQSAAPAPLARPPGDAAWKKWVPDLASSVPGTRWQAVQALGETHDLGALPHLVPLLGDADIFVRMATCRSLSNLGGLEAVPALIDALEDEEAAVRDAAFVALKGLTDAYTKESLPFDPLARDGDRSKRVKAWRAWWEEASKELQGKGKPRSKS
jgi:HEAT repeat protein